MAYVDLGAASESGSDSFLGTYSGTFELSGWNIAAVGLLPLSKRFGLQGKAGLFRWDLDATATSSTQGSVSASDDDFEPMLGIGGFFDLGKRIRFLIEYEKYLNVGDGDVFGEGSDVDLLSASVVFRF